MIRRTGLLLLAVAALVLCLPVNAWSVETDPRITAAVAAWKDQPVYVDPQYAEEVDAAQVEKMVARIATSPVPVFVAVVPTGEWYQEKGDTALLAGWMAAANGKPGLYLVLEDYLTTGVDHLVKAYAPRTGYVDSKASPADQLSKYLDDVKVGDRYEAEPARTTPLPPREDRPSEPERFTLGKAIGNGVGGAVIGLMGGALLAGVVLVVAALVARRGGGRS